MLKLIFLHLTKNFSKKTHFHTNTLKLATNPDTVNFISLFLLKMEHFMAPRWFVLLEELFS